MPSCTDDQKRRVVEMVEECGRFVTRGRCSGGDSESASEKDIRALIREWSTGFHRRRDEQALADRHHRVWAAGRQGQPVAHTGLLRRRASGADNRRAPRREARERQLGGRLREPFRRLAA